MKGFLQRNERLLTLVGAFIVFVGFFVREHFREKAKDFSSELETASAAHDLHRTLSQMTFTLSQIEWAQKKSEVKDLPAVKSAFQETLGDQINTFDDLWTYSNEILDHLPEPQPQLEDEALRAARSVEACREELSRISLQTIDGSQQAEASYMAKLSSDWLDAARQVKDFNNAVVKEAQKQRDDLKLVLKFFTIVEYMLFALGWSLGLLGKLYKTDLSDSESA